jgi:hypothetical protein
VFVVSNRSVGTETINGENLKGCWLPFGATWIVRRGDEYKNIFPVMDWGRVPGVTSPHMTTAFAEDITQPETFVGGVSDGTCGAAGMIFDQSQLLPQFSREVLRLRGLQQSTQEGHNAWFFFDREMMVLGARISSARDDRTGTTLNQTLPRGPVLIDGHAVETGESKVPPGSGVLHDGVGYTFLEPAAASLKAGPQIGDWQSISAGDSDAPVTEQVFSLWIDHGSRLHDAHYAYAVLPGISAPQLAEWVARPPVRVIVNTPSQQAVIRDYDITNSRRNSHIPATTSITLKRGQEIKPGSPEIEHELRDSDLEVAGGLAGERHITVIRTSASDNCPTPA